jgi:recombination protein U
MDFYEKDNNQDFIVADNFYSMYLLTSHLIEMGHEDIGFIIVSFVKLGEVYILTSNKLQEFMKDSKRKSIPLEYFKDNGYKVDLKYNLRLDYLKIVDKLIEGEI